MPVARPNPAKSASNERSSQRVVRLPAAMTDAAIVRAVAAREPSGVAALFDRYHVHVRRVLVHVLGPDMELADLVQEVFLTAMGSMERLSDPEALRGWLGSIAVFKARACVRQRARARIFQFFPTDELPDIELLPVPWEIDEAVRATYRVLERMPVDERIVFALRFIDGMELGEIAETCEVSLSTIKRRLGKAEERFARIAGREPSLADWLGGGSS